MNSVGNQLSGKTIRIIKSNNKSLRKVPDVSLLDLEIKAGFYELAVISFYKI